MKRIFGIFILVSFIVALFSSCERRCICTYNDSGAEELIYNAYSKKDCRTYEEDLKKLGMNVDCDFR